MTALSGTDCKTGISPSGTSPGHPPMERYLIPGSPGQAAEPDLSLLVPQADKITDGSLTGSVSHAAHTAHLSQAIADDLYAKMAEAVAALLSSTITAAVVRAVTSGIDQLRRERRQQAGRITEVEQCLSYLEEKAQSSKVSVHQPPQTQQSLLKKIDDLENHSRCNNFRIIGLLETYNSCSLTDLCNTRIPAA